MTQFSVYKLHFTSPLHIGDNRDDYGISLKSIQSDTLYAALTACLAKIGVKIPVDGDLGCAISSLFPFYQSSPNEEPVYFFPKPMINQVLYLKNVGNAKRAKKVNWIDLDYFNRVLNNYRLFSEDADIQNVKNSEFLTSRRIADEFVQSKVSQRVTISRTGDEDAHPFYMDRVYFKDYSGLFFISYGDESLLERGLKILQFEGIGTDRNVGNGFFEYEKSTINISDSNGGDMAISLSVFIPENEMQLNSLLDSEHVSYDFIRRGGWITTEPYNSLRKNSIYAFVPGSIFSMKQSSVSICGSIVNLKPEVLPSNAHPMWRCGKSIFLPIKI